MSDSNRTYIIFSPQDWNSQHSRSRAFAIELSKMGEQTIYVNPPSSFANVLRETISTVVYPVRRENIRFNYFSKFLNIWSPPILPTFYRGSLTPGFDRWLFKKWFDRKMSEITKPIIAIIAMPFWWDGYLNDYVKDFSATVFDYQDSIGTYARSDRIHQRMSELVTELLSHVSGIIAHTESNYRNLLMYRKPSKVCLIRNAGNDIIARRLTSSDNRKQLDHPVIGTVGRISNNIDVPLLLKLADRFPASSIVNIGTVSKNAHALRTKKNIVLMPPMLQDELHSNINHFNVGILPYNLNIEGSPLRVYDLLSELLQVVSTKFADAEYFRDVIHIAESHEEFLAKTADVLSDKRNWLAAETIKDFVSHNTWKMRAEELTFFCESLLGH